MANSHPDDEGLILTWDDHLTTMKDFYQMLFDTKYVTDVSLCVDGGSVRAHRIVLAMCSPYFREIFKAQTRIEPNIILPDIKMNEMEWLLEFMYVGSLRICRIDIDDLLRVAEKLKIKGLFNEKNQKRENEVPRPVRKETPHEFETTMSMNALQQFQPPTTSTSQMNSLMSPVDPTRFGTLAAINPALSLPNSMPLHNLSSLSHSFDPSRLVSQFVPGFIPSFIPSMKSPRKGAISPMSPCDQSRKFFVNKRRRKNYDKYSEGSDRSSVSPNDVVEAYRRAADIVNNINSEDEPKDLTINRPLRITSPKKEVISYYQWRDDMQAKLSMAYSNSPLVPTVPLGLDYFTNTLNSNGICFNKESISPTIHRPMSSHSCENRDSADPSFSSNNSEQDSPIIKQLKSSIEMETNNSSGEGLSHTMSSDRAIIPEPVAGPSVERDEATRATYFTALIAAKLQQFPHTSGIPAELQTKNPALSLTPHLTPHRRRQARNGNKKYECEKCARIYVSSGNLRRHKKHECGVLPQFCCPVCPKVFQHRHSVKIHVMSTHKNDATVVLEAEKNPAVLSRSTYQSLQVDLTTSATSDLNIQPPAETEVSQG